MEPILDSAPCGFLTVDEAGEVLRANATLAELVGRDRSAIEGHHLHGLLSAAGRIFYSTHLFPLLRLHHRADELYVPLVDGSGAEVPFLVNGKARADADRTVFDLVLVPMRQRNELESELISARNAAVEAAAAKDRFLSVVSHELRSPLSAITGYAELLLTERRGPLTATQRRFIERIRDAGQYQAGLIEDILDFAAVGERREFDTAVLPLEEILTRAESILTLRAQEEGKSLDRQPKPASGAAHADGRATQQILLNLGMNAIKYGRPGSVVRLEATEAGRRVRISVIDEGDGIEPDQVERIFQPFVQLTATGGGASSKKGVGLGLSISRDLARAMRGDITVTSVPGTGSTFTLDLPAV